MNENFNKYLRLLENCRVNKDDHNKEFTHMSLCNPVGKFNAPGKYGKQLLNIYSKLVNEGCNVYLIEKHRNQGPVVVDLDYKLKISDERVPEIINMKVINLFKKYCCYYLDLKNPEEDLECYILTKKEATVLHKEGIMKDGIHFIFPNICTEPNLQYLIRENVIEELLKDRVWMSFTSELVNDTHDIIDKAVIERNGWLMYGSAKPKYEKNKYELHKVITWIDEKGTDESKTCDTKQYEDDISEITGMEKMELDSLDIKNKNFPENEVYKIKEIDLSDVEKSMLPEKLSIRHYESSDINKLSLNITTEKINEKLKIYNKTKPKNTNVNIASNEDIELAKKLTSILNPTRAHYYETWLHLGFCLHNIDNSLIDVWIEFSKKSEKFKEGVCEKAWKSFKNYGYNMGSLIKWACEDDESKYAEIMLNLRYNTLITTLYYESYGVALFFYELYGHKFRVGSTKTKDWYFFNNHRWEYIDDGYKLKEYLNSKLPNYYSQLSKILVQKANNDPEMAETYEAKKKICDSIVKKLYGKYKESVIDEFATLCKNYDPDFIDKLDEQKHLLCFKNGVLDLSTETFRDGKPDDYLSLQMGTNYVRYDKVDPQDREFIENFVSSIQPNPNVRNCVLDLLSSCLDGYVDNQTFNILTGSGSNGKSLLMNHTSDCFGELAAIAPPEVLTRLSNDPDKPTPTMAKTKGVRLLIFEEPEGDDKLMVGKMKCYTGKTKIQARKLNQNTFDFYPQFTMFLLCNKLPTVNSSDGGTWRRIVSILFGMKFVSNPIEDYERPIDIKLQEKLEEPRKKDAYISFLVNHYFRKYKKTGLIIPQEVKAFTESYKCDSDILLDYINESLVFTGRKEDVINLNDIVQDYKCWCRTIRMTRQNIDRNEVKRELSEKIDKCKNNKWCYFILKNGSVESEYEKFINEENELSTYEKFREFKKKSRVSVETDVSGNIVDENPELTKNV